MKLGLPISVVLHVAFIGGTALHWGGEVVVKDELRIIPVEIVNISDISSAPRPAPVPTPKPDAPEPIEEAPIEEAPIEEEPIEEAPPVQNVEPDVGVDDAPPELAKIAPVVAESDSPKPFTTSELNTETETVTETVTAAVEENVTAKPKKPASLEDLFGLTQSTTQDYAENNESGLSRTQSEKNREQIDMAAREGELSTSYEDAVMRRVYNQWQIPAGAPDMESLVVTVVVDLSSEGRVTSARLSKDSASKAASDPFYNSAANSAIRAVNKAETFEFLPYDQYAKWQSMTLTFYPKNAPSSVPT